jgi:hypothetical protein
MFVRRLTDPERQETIRLVNAPFNPYCDEYFAKWSE